jgi:hypothetical protein
VITEIGIAAGDIWRLLDQKGRLEFAEVIHSVPAGKDLALMALGWLCREGHVVFKETDSVLHIQLRH